MDDGKQTRVRARQLTKTGWFGIVLLVLGVIMMFGTPMYAVLFFVIGGVMLWFGREREVDVEAASALQEERLRQRRLPWWGTLGWAIAVLVVLGGFANQMSRATVKTLDGHTDPFLTFGGVVILAAAFLLGLAGLLVKHLGRD